MVAQETNDSERRDTKWPTVGWNDVVINTSSMHRRIPNSLKKCFYLFTDIFHILFQAAACQNESLLTQENGKIYAPISVHAPASTDSPTGQHVDLLTQENGNGNLNRTSNLCDDSGYVHEDSVSTHAL